MTKLEVLLVKNFLEATTLKTKDCSSSKWIEDPCNIKYWGLSPNADGGKPLIIITT